MRQRPPTSGTRHGSGSGWGGDAKGAGTGGPARAFATGNKEAAGHAGHDKPALQARAERIEALNDKLFVLAMTADKQETQMQAAVHLLNRLEGCPVQRNVNVELVDPKELTDA